MTVPPPCRCPDQIGPFALVTHMEDCEYAAWFLYHLTKPFPWDEEKSAPLSDDDPSPTSARPFEGTTPQVSAATRTVEFAIEVVARMAIFNALDDIEWENYPEIGEHDWQQVLDRIEVIGCGLKPMDDDYAEAYALLASRAEKEA